MDNFSLYYPVRPYKLNQPWGTYRPDVYGQFGFTRHNGIDLALADGQAVRAPIECEVVMVGYEARGAGHYVILRTVDPFLFPDLPHPAYVEITFMHMQKITVQPREQVYTGELVGLGDNTGFSTGSHTHMRCRRVHRVGSRFVHTDFNEAQNTFDHAPFWLEKYADTQEPAFQHVFTRDLTFGMEDDEVRALQKALRIEGVFPLTHELTRFYGRVTLQAVKDFQRKHNIVSFGSPNTTGYGRVGKKTRAMLNVLFA